MRTVTLVDAAGNAIGTSDLLSAHTGEGKLHRAFSVYVFTPERRKVLIQQRSHEKMLWPMIWANTCCSHPFENEEAIVAGQRRLQEEMGFVCPLTPHSTLTYRALDPSGHGVEHEFLTLLVGTVEHEVVPKPNPAEVAAWKWVDVDDLVRDMERSPNTYAPWFHLGLTQIRTHD
jgi:isopentenyl-diphosphate delta-isomerase